MYPKTAKMKQLSTLEKLPIHFATVKGHTKCVCTLLEAYPEGASKKVKI